MVSFPTVFILAGGLGTRVSANYVGLPKAMIPIHNEPFIAHQLRLLAKRKIKRVVLCLGHLGENIAAFVGDGKQFNLEVSYSYDGNRLLGTGGAIAKACAKFVEPIAVLYGDSYLDTDFSMIYKAFTKANKQALLTVSRNNNKWIRSNLSCNAGLVTAYNKTVPTTEMKYVDYGLSIFVPQVFTGLENMNFDLSEIFIKLINHRELAAYEVKDRFYEVGSEEGIAELTKHLAVSI